jgi:cobalt-zinc-cadmium resistance protein CzcA
LQNVNYFETTALNNADIITRTAQKQLDNGSINYLEWVQLVNQAIDVRNEYIDAVRLLNQSINQLNYFTSK